MCVCVCGCAGFSRSTLAFPVQQAGYSGAQASHCGSLSCCRAQAVGMRASVVAAPGL